MPHIIPIPLVTQEELLYIMLTFVGTALVFAVIIVHWLIIGNPFLAVYRGAVTFGRYIRRSRVQTYYFDEQHRPIIIRTYLRFVRSVRRRMRPQVINQGQDQPETGDVSAGVSESTELSTVYETLDST